MSVDRLDLDALLAEAVATAGVEGADGPLGDTWRDGAERLVASLRDEADLHELGVEIAAGEIVQYLVNRMRIEAWREQHPATAAAPVSAPIIIVGQPRTGTTFLFDLLAQDPGLRVPLTWEVDLPMPPPATATYDTDPRIDQVQATIDGADALIPGFTSFHAIGARLGQECVRITAAEFASMIFTTQYRLPSYRRWLLDDADLVPAYEWHRRMLQHLQSEHPAQQWLLKSPAHLWHLDSLAAVYPDALIVQTHRDPLMVIASTSALATNLRAMASESGTMADIASEFAQEIPLGLDRGLDARARQVFAPERVLDVHFSDVVGDPMPQVERIYAALGRELTDDARTAMAAYLAANPGDGGGAGVRYRFSDTGLDADELRDRTRRYTDTYGVALETLG